MKNPYESPSSTSVETPLGAAAPEFPFVAAGPVLGTAVGVSHVAAMVGVWAFHGYPDFFFRAPESAWIGAVIMATGGAMFGLLYATVLRLAMTPLSLSMRPRVHFYTAVLSSIVITIIACEFSLQRRMFLNPLLTLGAIVACSFAAALATGKRVSMPLH